MQNLFQPKNKESQIDRIQSRLLVLAALIMVAYGIVLTLAPAVRFQAGGEQYQFQHWLGVFVWMVSFSLLHHQSSRQLENRDPYILPVVSLLSGIGLMTIWRLYPNLGIRQTAWVGLSALVVILGIQFPVFLNTLRRYKYIWLVLGLTLTALTIFLGTNPSGNGPTLWLQVLGVHFQPSEPLKLLLIVYLAGFFTDRLSVIYHKIENLIPTLFVTGIALLLLIFQKDLGTASIFLIIYLAILFTTGNNKILLWTTPILIFIIGAAGYFFIDIVRLRIDTWLNPFGDPSGASYQIIQSLIAIAEGGVIGAGPGLGSPRLVPVSVSDFIFSAIAEEMGFLGVVTIILLFVILLYRGMKMAAATHNTFYRYLSLGLVFYFGVQSILIIGGNVGLLPLTGVTLPFVSYGGSSLLVSFSALLILLTISDHAPVLPKSESPQIWRLKVVGWLMVITLIIEIILTSVVSFWFMPSLVERADNPRWIIDDRFKARGNILDRNNQILVTNTGEVGEFQRINNHTPLYPIIGYTNYTFGQTGIESSMFPYLRGYEGYPYSERLWQEIIYNQPPQGLNVRLTLDLTLQRTADYLLGDNVGTAILMNASSGEILAMASHPYFDAANLVTDWDSLINDEDAPLINRATQGLYPPGAALMPFIVKSQLNLIQVTPNPESLFVDLFPNLFCAQPVLEPITWKKLITNGCQSVQVELAERTGVEELLDLYQSVGLFTEPNFNLRVAEVSQPEDVEEFDFFRGLGSFKISPLQMALAASTLTNEGILPGPRIVNAYQNPEGEWITLPKLTSNIQTFTPDEAVSISNLMSLPESPFWQITTTVEAEDGDPITWFVAGTTPDWQGQPITVVVVLERKAPGQAERIGISLIEEVTQASGNIQD